MTPSLIYFRQWLHLRLRKHLVHPACSKLYRDSNRQTRRSVLVAGTGRSGTTWLGKLISSQVPARVMFEPFHSQHVKDYGRFNYFQYQRPAEDDPNLLEYCQRIFSGAIRHEWIDREVEHLRPRHRVVKAIRANLFLKWIRQLQAIGLPYRDSV